jgi:hypothetical protein
MGAAASSEAALKKTLLAALGPASSNTYTRLPRNPRRWTVQQVAVWLREIEMPALVSTMAENNIDGLMLLDDGNEDDIGALVPFPPLRRKLMRNISALKQQADAAPEAPADMGEVSVDIQRSLDQLNDSMHALAETIAKEAAAASGKPPKATTTYSKPEERVKEAVACGGDGDRDNGEEKAAIKIQALTRGNQCRKRANDKTVGQGGEAKEESEGRGSHAGACQVTSDDGGDGDRDNGEEKAAIKIQALTRGNQCRKRTNDKTVEQGGEGNGDATEAADGGVEDRGDLEGTPACDLERAPEGDDRQKEEEETTK